MHNPLLIMPLEDHLIRAKNDPAFSIFEGIVNSFYLRKVTFCPFCVPILQHKTRFSRWARKKGVDRRSARRYPCAGPAALDHQLRPGDQEHRRRDHGQAQSSFQYARQRHMALPFLSSGGFR